MSKEVITRIAIVGGGASGTLTAIQLLQNTNSPLSIKLINKDSGLARGFAYSTSSTQHLLNVRANNMSIFPDKPGHFIEWARQNNIDELIEKSHLPLEEDFMPRKYYGNYINDCLNEAIKNKKPFIDFEIIQKEAVDIEVNKSEYLIKFMDGSLLNASKIVLAFGNFLPANIAIGNMDFYNTAHYIRHPYNGQLFDDIKPEEEVLIIGTGLTAIDAVLQLKEKGVKGKITAISRNGLLPGLHVKQIKHIEYAGGKSNYALREIFSLIREEIKLADKEGVSWQNIIDGLRPYNQKLWMQFSEEDKRAFVKKFSPAWNVSRHRMAGAIHQKIEAWRKKEEFVLAKGGLQNLAQEEGRVRVELNAKHKEHSVFYVDKVINCSGPQSDYEKVEIPLIKSLVNKGIISSDPLRLGINATPEGAIIDRKNNVSASLFTLGPPLRGILWETIAMPEIRVQAKKLAEMLLY